jgi:hypothetical protein
LNNDRTELATWCEVLRQWRIHKHIATNYSFLKFDKHNFEYVEQLDLTKQCPVDVTIEANSYNVAGRFASNILVGPAAGLPIRADNFYDFIRLSTGWDHPLISQTRWTQNIFQAIDSQDIIKNCSDGGLRDGIAGFGSVLSLNGSIVTTVFYRDI